MRVCKICPEYTKYVLTNFLMTAVAPWYVLTFAGRGKEIMFSRRFSPGKFGGGAYVTVNSKVGSLIDWYNVQVSHLILRTNQS